MAKAWRMTNQDGEHAGWAIDCPACGYCHLFDQRWTFNGDVDKPTFRPSMNVNPNMRERYPDAIHCHSFVTDGRIQYLADCSHAMAGQTVDLPDVEPAKV